jgi:AcrR family transcriptional regulator
VRRDAQRNLEKLIQAAREVFAERGLDAPLEQIAQRAGVSIGTLYNRFPDRFALIDAVLLDRMEENLRIGEEALAHDDPWEGFAGYLELTCALQARDRGVTDAISRRFPRAPKVDAACAEGFVQARQLIERAQRHGGLRGDFTEADLLSLLWANARIVEATISVDPNAWRRYLGFVLDGLRADAAHPIPDPPMRPDQIDQARLALGQR